MHAGATLGVLGLMKVMDALALWRYAFVRAMSILEEMIKRAKELD